jgi:hypothetical protein
MTTEEIVKVETLISDISRKISSLMIDLNSFRDAFNYAKDDERLEDADFDDVQSSLEGAEASIGSAADDLDNAENLIN